MKKRMRFKDADTRRDTVRMIAREIARRYKDIWEQVGGMSDDDRRSMGEGTMFDRLRPSVGVVELTYDTVERAANLYGDIYQPGFVTRRQAKALAFEAFTEIEDTYRLPTFAARPYASDLLAFVTTRRIAMRNTKLYSSRFFAL